ncbi:pilus assembly FimT family protein [Colwellia piezophila]|uniref:pilus assembly FimT family protein n=1 Tax=Colwellia piezophila TaxID=211668 RepID=UPI0003614B02|nr:type II secretion system protein [Colwellia piezophila]
MRRDLKSKKGFTLIELVVVIVILGILAVTAAPKFIDLTSDAKAATLETIGGSMASGLQLIHARAIIEDEHIGTGVIQINGVDIPLYNGYPAVDGTDSFPETNAQLKAWLELDIVDRNTANENRDAAEFFSDKASTLNQIYIFYTEDYDRKSVRLKCLVRYINPVTKTPQKPTITVLTAVC